MYTVLKYIVLALNLAIVLLIMIGNSVKDYSDAGDAKRTISAAWITAIILVLNSALILVR